MVSHWNGLWASVKAMGAEEIRELDITLPPSKQFETIEDLKSGFEIDIGDLDVPQGGLLSHRGRHVLVYIPEQGMKYHVSHCSTLEQKKRENTDDRYVATNDTSGTFYLENRKTKEKKKGALKVCKNCLLFLNYQNYSASWQTRQHVFANFDLAEFFSIYSSLFKYQYTGAVTRGLQSLQTPTSQTGEHHSISSGDPRACESCKVSLASNVELSANNSESANGSSRILCRDCLRKSESQSERPVFADEMRSITAGRRKQGLLDSIGTWSEAIDLVDPAFAGLMRLYERHGFAIPEIGYPLTDSQGSVLDIEVALAWEKSRKGVVATDEEKVRCESLGWNVLTLHEALLDIAQDGH